MFICGSGSLTTDDAELEAYGSPCSTPKRSRRNTSFCKILGRDSGSKNPYADRGLDKFYALLADLDSKKQKIYTQKGSEDISFVRFVYANDSDSVKPIVVKVRERNPVKSAKILTEQPSFKSDRGVAAPPQPAEQQKTVKKKRSLRCKECNFNFKIEDLKRPHFYFPVVLVLILLFLAIYGRSFAILCTSIGWYLAPTVAGGSGGAAASAAGERKPKRKKSEKAMAVHSEGPSSPKSVINGLNRVQQQQQHDRKRSW